MIKKMQEVFYEEFEPMSNRLDKLLNVFISEYNNYDECIFISDQVSLTDVKQILFNKCDNKSIIDKILVLYNGSDTQIQYILNNIEIQNTHKRILILLHTRTPIQVPNYDYTYVTVYNYTQKNYNTGRGLIKPYIFTVNDEVK